MSSPRNRRDLRTASGRAADDLRRRLGAELRRLRTDSGLSIRAVAHAAAVDPSHLASVERGSREASLSVLSAIAQVLGVNVSIRLYAATKPAIRDRHQAPIVEALIGMLGPLWRPHVEVPVRRPVRGVVDLVLVRNELVVAVEVHSELRSVEQVIRWSAAKADALPSSDRWPAIVGSDRNRIERLLVVRSTRTNRDVMAAHRKTFESAFLLDPAAIISALRGDALWPGPALLWARTSNGRAAIVARQPPSRRRAR